MLKSKKFCNYAIMSERSGDPDRIENPDRSVRSVGTIVQFCSHARGAGRRTQGGQIMCSKSKCN